MSPPARRVAVTGLGAVAALGQDVPALWAALVRGECGIRPIAGIPTDRLTVRTAAELQGFAPEAHFDRRRLPMLDRTAQLALVAAREAMHGVSLHDVPASRAGVVLGAAIGQQTLDASYQALYGEGAGRLHPLTVPRVMPSGPASHVATEFGIRGPCFAAASACASASHAIGLAFQMIRAGMLDVAVTGGSDASICVGFMRAWDALRVLSPDFCRPFSKDRTGLVIGEGAGILVLEDWRRARARGAPIHAELIGFGMSADAADLTAPDAAGAARAVREALTDAGLPPEAIDYVNAHGTGTRLNDRTEATILADVFGRHLPRLPVSSTKSMLGHCLNAGGALELIVTALALREGVLPPTIGFREPDPDCALDCVPNRARPAPIEVAMSNSFAFGGLNAVLVLRRAD
ncbi:MAG: beta-ketoacyl-[acyl-carrier-protein] synthase family protein [Acidisphaera sp.]|nr:beta-ketoacyl-[acyl-carrier-protein] synthase family protein [Acidisphaera sp.]